MKKNVKLEYMSNSAVLGFAAGLGAAAAIYFVLLKFNKQDGRKKSSGKADRFRVENGQDSDVVFEEYVPPLPQNLKEMLCEAQLCHLSCIDDGAAPHTSLMNFTFVEDGADSLIVMTTRRDTKKYVLIEKNSTVGLLFHDFPQIQSNERSFKRTLSISITGLARIEVGSAAERYRKIHLNKNLQYAQFIEGGDKAVITIKIMQARMCNIQDHVTSWTRPGS